MTNSHSTASQKIGLLSAQNDQPPEPIMHTQNNVRNISEHHAQAGNIRKVLEDKMPTKFITGNAHSMKSPEIAASASIQKTTGRSPIN